MLEGMAEYTLRSQILSYGLRFLMEGAHACDEATVKKRKPNEEYWMP